MFGYKKKSLGAKSGAAVVPSIRTFWPVEKALISANVLELAFSW